MFGKECANGNNAAQGMKFSDEITAVRPGCRCGHALSAACVPPCSSLSSTWENSHLQHNKYNSWFRSCKITTYFYRFFTLSKISNDLSIAVRHAFVIVHVAVITSGLVGPSSADQFHPTHEQKTRGRIRNSGQQPEIRRRIEPTPLDFRASRTHREKFACQIG